MARASLVRLLALFLAGAAALPIALATVAAKPRLGAQNAPAPRGDPKATVRRLISALTRSSGLVEWSFERCCWGKVM